MNRKEFLTALFGTKPEGLHILIWTLSDKRSNWFKDISAASDFMDRHDTNVYVGAGLSDKDRGPGRRVQAKSVAGLPGFYCDIDIKGDAHKKELLPATLDEALSVVKGHGFDPTVVVHSGNGIQAWWLFHNVAELKSKGEREHAAELSRRLGHVLNQRGKKQGWKVDSVFDLARVLRPPDTWNDKNGNRKRAKVIEHNTQRYSMEDFDELLPELNELELFSKRGSEAGGDCVLSSQDRQVVAGRIMLRSDAEPPRELHRLLMDTDPKFNATWEKERDSEFPSSSEYHQSIANLCANVGWSEQQIADTIVAWNRRHGCDLKKVLRPKYMTETVAKAVKAAAQRRDLAALETAANADGTAFEDDKIDEEAQDALKRLLGFAVQRVIKIDYGDDDDDKNVYLMETAIGEIKIGPYQSFKSNTMFCDAINNKVLGMKDPATGQRRNGVGFTKKEWKATIFPALCRLVEIRKAIKEATVKGTVEYYLRAYLDNAPPISAADAFEIPTNIKPFVHKGRWHINLPAFHRYLAMKIQAPNQRGLTEALQKLGCKPTKIKAKTQNNVQRENRAWRVPQSVGGVPGGSAGLQSSRPGHLKVL